MKETKTRRSYTTPYELDGRVPLGQAIPLGLQHVLAMFVGNLSPLLVLMGICGITAQEGLAALRVSLLQNAMLVAGLVTLLQLYPIGPVGARLPIVMGTSSGFLGVHKSVAVGLMGGIAAGTVTSDVSAGIYAYGAIMGASLLGGIFETGIGFLIKPLRKFFPPVVTGTVVLAIGLNLIPVGISAFGGGSGAPDNGSLWNLLLGAVTLTAILVFKHAFKGFPSMAAILLGILTGYVVSFVMGLCLSPTLEDGTLAGFAIDWPQMVEAPWFAMPELLPVRMQFDRRAIIPMLFMFIVTAVETVGDTAGVAQGGLGREATDREMSGAVICDGIGSALASLFGVLPNTSFGQNVGLVGMTKVVNRFTIAMGAAFLVLAGLVPKIATVISIMPQPVLGGAAVVMFASIVVSGINLLTSQPLKGRSATIVAVAMGLGYGFGSIPAVQAFLPEGLRLILGGSGVIPAALLAILLNIVLPKDKES